MKQYLAEKFCWFDFSVLEDTALTAAEKYQRLITWAETARGINPNVFDEVTQWILDDACWEPQSITAFGAVS